jgi:hypothetical protein
VNSEPGPSFKYEESLSVLGSQAIDAINLSHALLTAIRLLEHFST